MISTSFDNAFYDKYDDEDEIIDSMSSKSKFINLNDITKLKIGKEILKSNDFYDINNYFKLDSHEAYLSSYNEADFIGYMYNKINSCLPTVFRLEDIDALNFLNEFVDKCDIPQSSYYKIVIQSNEDTFKHTNLGPTLITLKKDFIIYIDGRSSLVLFYNNDYENKKDSLLYTILGLIKNFKKPKVTKNKIYIVHKSQNGFDKTGFDIKKVKVNLEENYNDDFIEISEKIIKGLNNNKESHLILLSGIPGTGKTSYIRVLASKLKKNIIFISPDMVNYITDPSFIPFLMKNNNSVLVIEDAEPALQKRDGDGRSGAISNVLNLTDGLLSDCLNISIVATYNTNTKNIDEALLRKGRLLMNYKFEKLSKEKSTKLLNKLGFNIEAEEDMSLAEIYNYDKDNNTKDLNKPIIKGFYKK
jgi:broad-specificity NMP kinase